MLGEIPNPLLQCQVIHPNPDASDGLLFCPPETAYIDVSTVLRIETLPRGPAEPGPRSKIVLATGETLASIETAANLAAKYLEAKRDFFRMAQGGRE